MKIAAFMGSPRKNQNTDSLLNAFLKGIKENSNAKISNIFLQKYNISNCLACDSCKTSNQCVLNDDMQNIYPIFRQADIVIFATPIYWWSMSAQMKTFIDRLYCIGSENMKGKKAYVLMTYGGELPNSGPELVEKTFKDIFDYVGIELKGVLGGCSGDTPIDHNTALLNKAYDMGKKAAVLQHIDPR